MERALKHKVLVDLEAGGRALHEALIDVDDTLAVRPPKSGGWSILQCVEHVAVSERDLLSRLRRARPGAQFAANPARESIIAQRASDRTQRIEAPSEALPADRFKTLKEALTDFAHARAETMHWLEEFNDDLRGWGTDHPLIPGPVNCYEILLLIAAHPERHARQVRAIRNEMESGVAPGTGSEPPRWS